MHSGLTKSTRARIERLVAALENLRCASALRSTRTDATLVDGELYSIVVTLIIDDIDDFQSCDEAVADLVAVSGLGMDWDGTGIGMEGPPFARDLFFYRKRPTAHMEERAMHDDAREQISWATPARIGNPFADIEPRKGAWRVVTPQELERHPEVLDEVFDLISSAYSSIGGHLKIRGADDLLNEANYFELVDLDDDPQADAAILGKRKRGVKQTAMGHDQSKAAKQAIIRRKVEQLSMPGYYAEVSGRIAEILLTAGVPTIRDAQTVRELLGKPITWVGEVDAFPGVEGWYSREIGGHPETKIIVGLPSEGLQVNVEDREHAALAQRLVRGVVH
jgi:hypothetical protein